MNEREIVSRWIERKAQERDVPALTWLLQRTCEALMACYPSATREANTQMIVRHVETILGRGEGGMSDGATG